MQANMDHDKDDDLSGFAGRIGEEIGMDDVSTHSWQDEGDSRRRRSVGQSALKKFELFPKNNRKGKGKGKGKDDDEGTDRRKKSTGPLPTQDLTPAVMWSMLSLEPFYDPAQTIYTTGMSAATGLYATRATLTAQPGMERKCAKFFGEDFEKFEEVYEKKIDNAKRKRPQSNK